MAGDVKRELFDGRPALAYEWVWVMPQPGEPGDGWIVCSAILEDGTKFEISRWLSTSERHARLMWAAEPKMEA